MAYEPVEWRARAVDAVRYKDRIIEVIAAPYGSEAEVPLGNATVMESLARGAFNDDVTTKLADPDSLISVNRDHDYGKTIGRVESFEDTDRGFVVRAHIAETPLGDETLALADIKALKASVGMMVARKDQVIRDGKRIIKRALLDHVALLPNPAYSGAAVLAVRRDGLPDQSAQAQETPRLDDAVKWLHEIELYQKGITTS